MRHLKLSISVPLTSPDQAERLIKASMNLLTIAIEHRFESWMRWYAIDADGDIRGYEHMPRSIQAPRESVGYWDIDYDGNQSLLDSRHKSILQIDTCRGWRATLTKIKS